MICYIYYIYYISGKWRPAISVDQNVDNELLSISSIDMIWGKGWKQEIFRLDNEYITKRDWESSLSYIFIG